MADGYDDHDDPLKDAFGALRTSALPSMRPVGIDGVVTTVRRRHRRRVAGSTVAVLLVAVAVAVGLSQFPTQHHASHVPATVIVSPSASAPEVTVIPSPSAPSGSVSPSAPSRVPPPAAHTTAPAGTKDATCAADGTAVLASGGATMTIRFEASDGSRLPPCASVHIPVFWASYTVNDDGTGALYSDGVNTIGRAKPSITFTREMPSGCGVWFVGRDVKNLPQSLPAAAMNGSYRPTSGGPFWDATRHASGLFDQGRTGCDASTGGGTGGSTGGSGTPSGPPSPQASAP